MPVALSTRRTEEEEEEVDMFVRNRWMGMVVLGLALGGVACSGAPPDGDGADVGVTSAEVKGNVGPHQLARIAQRMAQSRHLKTSSIRDRHKFHDCWSFSIYTHDEQRLKNLREAVHRHVHFAPNTQWPYGNYPWWGIDRNARDGNPAELYSCTQ
jgi:hypothetical protein